MKIKYFLNKDVTIALYILLALSVFLFCISQFQHYYIAKTDQTADNKPQKVIKQEVKVKKSIKNNNFEVPKLTSATSDYKNAINALKDRKYEIASDYSQKKQFCTSFFNDFRVNKNVQIIKPIIHTNDYNDKKLQPYWKKCPNLERRLNETATFEPRGYDYIKDLPYEEQRKYAKNLYKAHFGFKLFDIDFDNNPKNDKQTLFYASGVSNKEYRTQDYYEIIDFNKCSVEGGHNVYQMKSDANSIKGSYTGLIKYNEKYYIYEVTSYDAKTGVSLVEFSNWNDTWLGNVEVVCN